MPQGRKSGQAVSGVGAVFLHDGFAGARLNDMGWAARLSKARICGDFPGKALMCRQAMRDGIRTAGRGCCTTRSGASAARRRNALMQT